MKRAGLSLLAVLVLTGIAAAQDMDYDIYLNDVELRPGILVNLHIKVYVNESHHCWGKTILMVPSGYLDATHYQALAEEMFADNPIGPKLCRMAVLDLPGHGLSALPEGSLRLGDLTLKDYEVSLAAAMNSLPEYGLRPKTVMGHCMGALVIQMVQQSLIAQGTSLRKTCNVRNVVFFAPTPPAAVPWSMRAVISMFTMGFYSCFTGPGGVLPDPSCAMFDFDMDLDVDFADFLLAFPTATFDCDPATTPLGVPPLPAPAPGYCDPGSMLGDWDTNYDVGGAESMTVVMEMLAGFQYLPPMVDAEAFGRKQHTRCFVVNYEFDNILPPVENILVYEYLTGDTQARRYCLVEGPTATHWMSVLDPRAMLDALAGRVWLP